MIALAAVLLALAQEPVADGLRTVAERSGYRATARYDDVVALGKRLGEFKASRSKPASDQDCRRRRSTSRRTTGKTSRK